MDLAAFRAQALTVRTALRHAAATLTEEHVQQELAPPFDTAELVLDHRILADRADCIASKFDLQQAPLASIRYVLSTVKTHPAGRNYALEPEPTASLPAARALKDEVIITVRVQHRVISSQLWNEYDLLHTQDLHALHGVIPCSMNKLFDQVASGDGQLALRRNSGFFFIEDRFYADSPSTQAQYVDPLMTWLREDRQLAQPVNTEQLESLLMDRPLSLIPFKLHKPYVYVHQGDCEHSIIFSNVRLTQSHDCQDPSRYPLCVVDQRRPRTKCLVCQVHNAKFVLHNDVRAMENPSFVCQDCYEQMHGSDASLDFEKYFFPPDL
eukprot:m.484791 g.484791  ORF g.484791 m.484791 type:complete len:324 (-) comp57204_c0_seq7:2643-3614(-)